MNTAAQPAKLSAADERERLILQHLPQVHLIARRIHARLPGNICLDDLVSTGILGLIAAVDRFDPGRNFSLGTYAEHKIKGKILDSLRQQDWAPRRQRQRAKQISAATAVAEQRLQRSPTGEEIATELNLPVATYQRWRLQSSGLNVIQMESSGSGDANVHDLLLCLSSDQKEWPSAVFERRELRDALAAAIAGIPDMEKTVLSLYYHEELTLREIAKIVGLHESRISQLKSQAILRLRDCMSKLGHGALPPPATMPQYSAQAC
jgi:RNA polymerase sigma factor for flagellar operon FliA